MTGSGAHPKQGELWMVNFSPVAGHEQDGMRPALVVSRNEMNRTGLCMVVPGTRTQKNRPGRVSIPRGEGGLPDDTYLLCDQLRTVDPVRFIRRIGAVDARYTKQVLTLLHYFLSFKE